MENRDLVIDAVAKAKVVSGNMCVLSRTRENGLDSIEESFVRAVLSDLSNKERVIEYADPEIREGNLVYRNRRVDFAAMRERIPTANVSPEQKERARTLLAELESADFHFLKRPNFDNWYAAHLLKKNGGLKALSPLNLDKVYITVLDIDEQMQMNPRPQVKVNLFFGHKTALIPNNIHTGPYRSDALEFLKNNGVVFRFDIHPMGFNSFVVIDLDIQKFQEFKGKIFAFYEARENAIQQTPPAAKEAIEEKNETSLSPIAETANAVYRVEYTSNVREVIVNGLVLAKLDFNSENDNILSFLIKNPNRAVTIEELSQSLGGQEPKKDLHKFAENIGFRGDLKKAFLNISKNGIMLTNPVTAAHLQALGLQRIKLTAK